MSDGPRTDSEVILYQTSDGATRLEVRLENETVWLAQKQMAELFQTTKQNVSLHIHNIFAERELEDFIVRLKQRSRMVAEGIGPRHLVLETKGFDPLKDIKRAAAERWCAAVNAHGEFGSWTYRVVAEPGDVPEAVDSAAV